MIPSCIPHSVFYDAPLQSQVEIVSSTCAFQFLIQKLNESCLESCCLVWGYFSSAVIVIHDTFLRSGNQLINGITSTFESLYTVAVCCKAACLSFVTNCYLHGLYCQELAKCAPSPQLWPCSPQIAMSVFFFNAETLK